MLRIHFLQQWVSPSDPAMEEALSDVPLFRDVEQLPEGMVRLPAKGVMLKTGSTVDATLIEAPNSTKNSTGSRDPEKHQTRTGNNCYFGM